MVTRVRRSSDGYAGPTGGFSLVEAVIIIVIVGIAAGGLLTLYAAISRQTLNVDDRQRALMLIESCAEVVWASRALLPSTFIDSLGVVTETKGSSSALQCATTDALNPLCECYLLRSLSPHFGALEPEITIVYRKPEGTTTTWPSGGNPALCYSYVSGTTTVFPDCVQLTIGVRGGTGSLTNTLFLQLQE